MTQNCYYFPPSPTFFFNIFYGTSHKIWIETLTRKVGGVVSYPISPFSHSVSFALRDIGKLPNIIWSIGRTLSNIDISRHNIISYVCSLKAIVANKFTAWISIAVFCQFSGILNSRKNTRAIVIREVQKSGIFSWNLPLGTFFHFPFQINPIGAENSFLGPKTPVFLVEKSLMAGDTPPQWQMS